MTAQEMFENLGYEKKEDFCIKYTSKSYNHMYFKFYKESPNHVITSITCLNSEELKACLKQIEELENKESLDW